MVQLLFVIFFTNGLLSASELSANNLMFKPSGADGLAPSSGAGDVQQLEVGLLFQKSYHFYWENGITATYRAPFILKNRLGLGFNFLSSRMGTALGTNAIKQEQILIFGQFDFRPGRNIRPFVQANFGYIKAQFDQLKFSSLEDQSLLTSINAGVAGTIKENWILKGSLGYNIIGGDGQSGLATIYPLIFHLSAQYIIKL